MRDTVPSECEVLVSFDPKMRLWVLDMLLCWVSSFRKKPHICCLKDGLSFWNMNGVLMFFIVFFY